MILMIYYASLICDISPAKIEAHIRVESNYCKYKLNKKSSAKGCMQLLKVNRNVFDTIDMRDDYKSILAGTKYLCKLKASFPRTYNIRYFIGPNGKIKSNEAISYKEKLNTKLNKYYKE